PARRRDLDHPRVVERALRRIERRVGPDGDQLGRADRVRPRRAADVDRVADGRHLAVRVARAIPAPRDVVYLLVHAAVLVEPALHDLHAVEVRADRIAQRTDEEAWRARALRRRLEVTAHRDALRVARLRRIARLRVL